VISIDCCFQAEDGIRGYKVTGVQTCALPIYTSEVFGHISWSGFAFGRRAACFLLFHTGEYSKAIAPVAPGPLNSLRAELRSRQLRASPHHSKSGLNRAILDASPFELRRQLEYKALWRGEGC